LNASAPPEGGGRHRAYFCLGSNIRPEENIRAALGLLCRTAPVLALSTCWETQALGRHGQPIDAPNFLNLAACVSTSLEPAALKARVIAPIEAALGRVRGPDKYAPRTIDLDLSIYDDQVLDPHLWERGFLALTFADLLPALPDPRSGETLWAAAERFRQGHLAIARTEIVFPPECLGGA
jgi:2-amino-4-hydroxy-6-hydroxymethyldihydropteridine diphosphokinase